jgi:hypothetical protein
MEMIKSDHINVNIIFMIQILLVVTLIGLFIYVCINEFNLYEDFITIEPNIETIFVSIASYRDDECNSTISNLYQNADIPKRIFVGACQQNKLLLETCFGNNSKDESLIQNVRLISIPFNEAKGPTYARYLCSTLYRNETYFMQIDSHTQFEKGWDSHFITMMNELKSQGIKKPILSQYPVDVTKRDEHKKYIGVLCDSKFNDNGMITFLSVLKENKDNKYFPTPFTAGGFLFMQGSALYEVPFDPLLPYLFEGEEILYSARLWTSGYDIYTPNITLLYHHYIRKEKPHFWEDIKDWYIEQKNAHTKVKYLLGMSSEKPPEYLMKDIEKYGMGKERSLEDYWNYAGINIQEKKSESSKKFC